jgi:hypothetical protein
VTGGLRKLHNEELPISIIRIIKPRRMRWAGHVAQMREKWNVYSLLVGKPEGKRTLGRPRRKPERKRPLGRPRSRWIYNITMDLLEMELRVMD